MEKSRRKRTVTERIPPPSATVTTVATAVEEDQDLQRPLKIALKPPTPDVKSAAIFEECLNLETVDCTVKTLLQLNDSVYPRILEDWGRSGEGIQKLWTKYCEDTSVCSILINIMTKLLPHVKDISQDHQTFLLSLINHGMYPDSVILK